MLPCFYRKIAFVGFALSQKKRKELKEAFKRNKLL